jgi:hypothetical protein
MENVETKFIAEYRGKTLPIDEKFLVIGEERKLLSKLNKKFALGSGHELMELSKLDDDTFRFHLLPYYGAPNQTVYIDRIK